MARASYFKRIARTEKPASALRPPAAIFRRWELIHSFPQRQGAVIDDAAPLAESPARPLSPSMPSRPAATHATPPHPASSKRPPAIPIEASVVDVQRPRAVPEEPARPRPKSERSIDRREAQTKESSDSLTVKNLTSPAQPQISKLQTTRATATSAADNSASANARAKPKSKSTRTRDQRTSETAPEARAVVFQPSEVRLGETSLTSAEKPVAILVPKPPEARRSDPGTSRPHVDSRSEPRHPAVTTQRAAPQQRPDESQPTVKIGTIDVQIVPSPPSPKTVPTTSSGRRSATVLSRGFTTSFGLRQG